MNNMNKSYLAYWFGSTHVFSNAHMICYETTIYMSHMLTFMFSFVLYLFVFFFLPMVVN